VATTTRCQAIPRAWQLRQAEEAEEAQEAWRTDGHIFTMRDGRPLDPAYVTRLLQKLRTRADSSMLGWGDTWRPLRENDPTG
jgi:hypothetical protein